MQQRKPDERRDGAERKEPGKPTRQAPPAEGDAARIGRQQGTTQRGFTDDAGATPHRPAPTNEPRVGKR
jgi:hypothetical protein